MKIRKEIVLLALIFFSSFAIRLFVAFSSPNYSYDAYFNIHQANSIKENLLPAFSDPKFYVPHPFMPLFHYILAFFLFFLDSDVVFKIVPNLIASLSIFICYLISLELTRSKPAALFSAMSVGFIPVFILKTANSVSPYTLIIPLMLLLIYAFLKLEKLENRITVLYMAAFFALVFTHPSSLIFVLGLSLYLVILYILRAKPSAAEVEVIFFSLIAALWIIFLFFKEPLLVHGFSILWQNFPDYMIVRDFAALNVIDAIYGIGILTFLAGIFITYKYLFEKKRKDVHVLISLSLLILILLGLRLLSLDVGLIFLGIFFAVISGEAYLSFSEYLKKTHISKNMYFFTLLIILGFLATSALPSFFYKDTKYFDEPGSGEVAAFLFLANESAPGSVVFSDLKEGNLVVALSHRKNFIDDRFLMSENIGKRLLDMETIFTTKSQINALEILDRYGISYLVITKRSLDARNQSGLPFYSPDCFFIEYQNKDVLVYRPLCRVSR